MAGTIVAKGNGKYKFEYMKDHERYYRTVNCNTYSEAEVLLAAFITEINEGIYVKPSKCTLEQFVYIYINEYGIKNLATETLYRHIHQTKCWVLPKLGKFRLQDIKPNMWADFFSWLSTQISPQTHNTLAPSTIERIFEVLCSIYSCAIQLNYCKINCIKESRSTAMSKKIKNKIKKSKQIQSRCLSYTEAFKLIDALENVELKYKLIVHFAIVGGLRRSEILGIKWANVNFKTNIVQIRQSSLKTATFGFEIGDLKTVGSFRDIYMPDTTMNLLKQYKEITPNTDNDLVFINNRGKRIGQRLDPDSVTRWFYRFRKKIGLPDEVPLHGLRHTSATILIAEGIDIKNVSGRLGHSNTDTTLDIYSHALVDVDRLACNTLEKYLYEDIEDFKIPSSPYTLSTKKYKSKIKLTEIINNIQKNKKS